MHNIEKTFTCPDCGHEEIFNIPKDTNGYFMCDCWSCFNINNGDIIKIDILEFSKASIMISHSALDGYYDGIISDLEKMFLRV